MKDMAIQLQILDDFVTRARLQNEKHHETHLQSLHGLASTVMESHSHVSDHFTSAQDRVHDLDTNHLAQCMAVEAMLPSLTSTIQVQLTNLRAKIAHAKLKEYSPTGETPQKTHYDFPTTLPRTEPQEKLLAKLSRPTAFSSQASSQNTSPNKQASPSKQPIYNDAPVAPPHPLTPVKGDMKPVPSTTPGLREIDVNITAGAPLPNFSTCLLSKSTFDIVEVGEMGPPPFKRQAITMDTKLPQKHRGGGMRGEGRENTVPTTTKRRLRSSHHVE